MKQFFLIAIALSCSVLAAVSAEDPQLACTTNLQQCTQTTEAIYNKNLQNYQFQSACSAMRTMITCYDTAIADTNCQSMLDVLPVLKASVNYTYNTYCPGGQPDQCLRTLKTCVTAYQNMTQDTSPSTMCSAADLARACVEDLVCPFGALNATVQQFILEVYDAADAKTCSGTDYCSIKLLSCMSPLYDELDMYQQDYDYVNMCLMWKQAKVCVNSVKSDPKCQQEDAAFMFTVNRDDKQYHDFCDDNDKPKECLKRLGDCSTYYAGYMDQPLYKTDSLYACTLSLSLLKCIQSVKIDPNDCVAINQVDAVAALQHKAVEEQNSCSTILNSCTSLPSNCTVQQDMKMSVAKEMFQYDKVCHGLQDAQKCIDPYVNTATCQGKVDLLVKQQAHFTNYTSLICQATDKTKAQPCLQSVTKCAGPYLKTLDVAYSMANLCTDLKTFTDCVDKINCKEPFLEGLLNQAKLAGQRGECSTGNKFGASVGFLMASMAVALKLIF